QVVKGENDQLTVTFVTDGIHRTIELAKAAAGEKHVMVVGGANTAQQCLRAGLVDEIHMGIVPVLLGEGLRFFEPGANEQLELDRTRVFESPTRTDLWFRVVKEGASVHERLQTQPRDTRALKREKNGNRVHMMKYTDQ